MLSSKPYLFGALYEWILDSGCTPHMVVDASMPEVDVPRQHVRNGQIVLNISPSAVSAWVMDKDVLSFSARFSGTPVNIHVPMYAVLGIYARENGQGMMFGPESVPDPDPENFSPGQGGSRAGSASSKPSLRVVK